MFAVKKLSVFLCALASLSVASPQAGSPTTDLTQDPRATVIGPKTETGSTGDTLKARKETLRGYGADAFDIGVALQEHSIGMAADSQEDGTQNNQGGTGDGANFGMFNLNWYMIRSSPGCGDLSGLSEGEWTRGTELNTNEQLAVQCMKATRTHFGDDWWGYQRAGKSLCQGSPIGPSAIALYKKATQTIGQFMQGHLDDNVWESYNVCHLKDCNTCVWGQG